MSQRRLIASTTSRRSLTSSWIRSSSMGRTSRSGVGSAWRSGWAMALAGPSSACATDSSACAGCAEGARCAVCGVCGAGEAEARGGGAAAPRAR